MKAMILIGTPPKAVNAMRKAVVRICESNSDDRVKEAALKVLQSMRPDNISISNCWFTNEAPKPEPIHLDPDGTQEESIAQEMIRKMIDKDAAK